jgi:hypothetical protein
MTEIDGLVRLIEGQNGGMNWRTRSVEQFEGQIGGIE